MVSCFQAVRAVPGGGGLDWFWASPVAAGAPEALAPDGGFRTHFLSGPENALRHRNLRTHFIRTGLAEAFRSPRHKAAITLVSRSLLGPLVERPEEN